MTKFQGPAPFNPEDLTPEQVAEILQKAKDWRPSPSADDAAMDDFEEPTKEELDEWWMNK